MAPYENLRSNEECALTSLPTTLVVQHRRPRGNNHPIPINPIYAFPLLSQYEIKCRLTKREYKRWKEVTRYWGKGSLEERLAHLRIEHAYCKRHHLHFHSRLLFWLQTGGPFPPEDITTYHIATEGDWGGPLPEVKTKNQGLIRFV